MKNEKHSLPEGMQFRSVEIRADKSEDGKTVSVRMSVSSETPVLTYLRFNDQWMRAYEVLDHKPESVDMSRCTDGLVIQDTHWGDQVGLMRVELKEAKLGGVVEFCTGQRAQDIAADAAKGLRKNVSVGYVVDPGSYRLEGDKDGYPLVRATRWMPYEASFVPVPADVSVGVGRNAEIETAGKPPAQTVRTKMSKENEAPKLDAEQVVEIYRLARAFNMEPGQADEHIKSGKSVEEFRVMTLKKAEADQADAKKRADEAAKSGKKPDRPAELTSRQAEVFDESERREIGKRFNVMNLLRYLDESRNQGQSHIDIGFEREVSKTVEKRSGKGTQGFIIPHSAMLSVRADPFLKGSNGSNMVQTTLMLPMIEALRSKMVLARAGVQIMSGLVGDVAFPKGGAIAGGWVDGENGAGTEGKPTIGQVTGTPKTASGWTDISRRLLIQSSVDVENFVQNELLQTIARLIEVATFAGTNANGQPKGLVNTANVLNPTVTVNAPTRAQIMSFVSNIAAANADIGGMAWMLPPAVWALLGNTPNGSVTILNQAGSENVGGGPLPGFLLDTDRGTMLGNPYFMSTNVTLKSLWLGVWNQIITGLWSGVDIVLDPYTNSTTGAVRVIALQDCDIMVRHPQAFAYNTALLS
jgi:HK97 family phage major capsid protein